MPKLRTHAAAQLDLERLVREWQPRLGLQAWTLKIVFAHALESLDRMAQSTCDTVHQIARIDVAPTLRPALYEKVVVHELLHVLWAPLEEALDAMDPVTRALAYGAHHQALDRVSRAVTGLDGAFPFLADCQADSAPWETT